MIENLLHDHFTSACDPVVPGQPLQLVIAMQRQVQPLGAGQHKRSPLKSVPRLRQHHLKNWGEEGPGSPLQQQKSFFLCKGETETIPTGSRNGHVPWAACSQCSGDTKAAFSAYLGNFVFPLLSFLSASSKLSLVLACLNFAVMLVWPSQFLNPATTDVCLLLLQLFYLSSSSFCLLFLPPFTCILCFQDPYYRGWAVPYD